MDAPPESSDSRHLPQELSRDLVRLGFDPGIPVYEIDDFDFDLTRVQQALFQSLASKPVIVPFIIVHDSHDASLTPEFSRTPWRVPVEIESVRVFYPPAILSRGQTRAVGCLEEPEWYLRGYVAKATLDPDPDRILIHAYLRTKGAERTEIEIAFLQLVRHPSDADSDTILEWGDGIPGQ